MAAIISTSRQPCARTFQFARELAHVLPYTTMINRGGASIEKLVANARKAGATRLVIVRERKGNPAQLLVATVNESSWSWLCRIRLKSVKLAKEFGKAAPPTDSIEINDSIGLVELLDLEPGEGPLKLCADKKRITFMLGDQEVGPAMLLEGLQSI